LVERDHADGGPRTDDHPRVPRAVRGDDLVDRQTQVRVVEHDPRLPRPPTALAGLEPVGDPAGQAGVGAHTPSTGSRISSLRRSAAATNPENRGCGRVGRERSSGWAWVAT